MERKRSKTVLILSAAIILTADIVCAGIICQGAVSIFLCLLVLVCSSSALAFLLFSDAISKHSKKRVGFAVKIIIVCSVSMFLAFTAFLNYSAYTDMAGDNTKIVVVLGAGINGDKPQLALQKRLDAAARFAGDNPETIIIVSGGQGKNEQFSEAEVMKKYLINKGIAGNRILKEDQSTNTRENFGYSLKILKKLGYTDDTPVAYATNAFHCFRAGIYARLEGYGNAKALPSPVRVIDWLPCYIREAGAIAKMIVVMVIKQ